jgi:hypothetical protein
MSTLEYEAYAKATLFALILSRGTESRQVHLQDKWYYDIIAMKSLENPSFDDEISHELLGIFASVRIEVRCYNYAAGSSQKLPINHLYGRNWCEWIKDRLYEIAEEWTKKLLGPGSASTTLQCTWGEERRVEKWESLEIWSRTIEVFYQEI